MMKEGDFVRVNYVGTIKESGLVFEVTDAEEAKKRGLFNPQNTYGTLPAIIGAGFVIKGLEDALRGLKLKEKKKVTIKAEDGFGKRDSKLVKIFPEAEFHKNNVVPYQGMPVTINNMMGRVLSNSGGRVKVDFNHPLAGKELIYDLEIADFIGKKEDKVNAVLEFYYGKKVAWEAKVDGNTVDVKANALREINPRLKQMSAEIMTRWIDGVEKVRFFDEYVKVDRKQEK
jgi:FKBP-type peptidyl-prolyl cis-trans isomerase 2